MQATFYTDVSAFLAAADGLLASDPLRFSVLASVAARHAKAEPVIGRPCWFATISDGDQVVGAAMRTHPDPPHAGFAPAMPSAAVDALAAALATRGERVPAWNGDLDACKALCEATADGAPVEVPVHLRLFECTEVIWPKRPDQGELVAATLADETLVNEWLRAFHNDAEVQGGRTSGPGWTPDLPATRQGIVDQRYWFWVVDNDPVHMTGAQPAAFGAQRLGPVYTPAEQRGHGYAAWVVATLAQRTLDAGIRPCLYTDQANPVSNKVYERIGFRRVQDEGQVIVVGTG